MYVYYWYAHKASWQSEAVAPWTPRPIEACQILKNWKADEATRDVRLTDTEWSAPYLNLNNIDARLNADDTQTISRDTASDYISWNIVTTAKNWLSGQPNYGILLSAANEAAVGRDIRFYSRKRSVDQEAYVEVLCASDKNSGSGEDYSPITNP